MRRSGIVVCSGRANRVRLVIPADADASVLDAMRVFLDFEASSLNKASYPIEVGWVFEDGREETYLIRPAPGWTDWDDAAEATHGITRERLAAQGAPHEEVCRRLVELFAANVVYAGSPPWDGKWLSVLLRGAGRPRHLLRLRDSDEAFAEAVRARLGEGADATTVAGVIGLARAMVEARPAAHRALADARREWQIWKELRRGEAVGPNEPAGRGHR